MKTGNILLDSGRKKDHVRRYEEEHFQLREPFSALSHLFGFFSALLGMPVLLIKAADTGSSRGSLISLAVFMLTMILLYGASFSYHAFNISAKVNRILKKIDHMSIFILIAGTYTPVCQIALGERSGRILLIAVWVIALAGIFFKGFFVYCPTWLSSIMYVAMGWAVLSDFGEVLQVLPTGAFLLLLIGGIFYTLGAVIYALKLSLFRNPLFGNHELFHLFVLAGSLCHYLLMLKYLTCM